MAPASIISDDRQSHAELAVAKEADSQEAWITAAHSNTVSLLARALAAASSQERRNKNLRRTGSSYPE
ncbi:unnamed protein product [Lota lota]